LKTARLLFHLQRHGIPAPALLAYGQMVPRVSTARSFVLCDVVPDKPLAIGDRSDTLSLLSRLHEVGCAVLSMGPGGEPFGMADGRVVVRDVSRLRLVRRLGSRHIERNRAMVEAFFRGRK
jgi:hypothetical protein